MTILKIAKDFEAAFIAAANASNDYPDDLDLSVSSNRERLYLSNNCPGFTPYLRIATREGDDVTVEICSTTNIRPKVDGGEWQYLEEVDAAVAVNLSDVEAAANSAVECWCTLL